MRTSPRFISPALIAGLLLVPLGAEEHPAPAKVERGKAEPPKKEQVQPDHTEPAKGAKPPPRKGVAIPENPRNGAHGPEAKEAEKAKTAPLPRPIPRLLTPRRPAAPLPAPLKDPRLVEIEAQSARLAQENARLQQELARRDSLGATEVHTPDEALAELRGGNARFIQGRRVRTLLSLQDVELRRTLDKGQAPFAVVLTCADSRLADNLIFDQELGRIFTVRVAGNVVDSVGLASVEYAAELLGSKLILVMGHTKCGAVKAITEAQGKPLPGNLWSLQSAMAGLLERIPEDPNLAKDQRLRQLERANAQFQAQALLDRSEILRHLVKSGKLQITSAVYELDSGLVSFNAPPSQSPEAEPIPSHAAHGVKALDQPSNSSVLH